MSQVIEIKIPDIGDFSEVDVIEVLVKAGDTVAVDDPLITLESDKASMDIPSSHAGTVKELKLAVGSKASEGTVICLMEVEGAAVNSNATETAKATNPTKQDVPPTSPAPASATTASAAGSYSGKADITCQMLVLGAGPGGYTAAFRAADLGMSTVLVERWNTLGGVCLNVGCIPSKALLHAAKVMDESQEASEFGIEFKKPKVDLDKLRTWKEKIVGRLTGGLAGLAKQRKVQVLQGVGQFLDPYHLAVTAEDDKQTIIRFEKAIIAAGSEAVKLPFIPDDPRVIDSSGALALQDIPKRLLVIGGGIIGLEMATVYAALGSKITVVEMLSTIIAGADKDVVRPYLNRIKKRYEAIWLETRVTQVEATSKGMKVSFEGKNAPAEPQIYDKILVAVGRTPNGQRIAADKAGIAVDQRGFVQVVDTQMRTTQPHIFAIGDIIGQPMLAHKAVHEGKTAAEAAAGLPSHFDARVIPSVAYTDPEIAWLGLTEEEAKAKGIQYGKGVFPWAASGRALSLGRDEGMTKLIFDESNERVIGAGIVGTNAGDLIAEVALAIEMGANAADIGLTVHPHPTLSETVAMSAELFEGTITDLYAPKKRK
ncbi:MAG: dihydrolipoyl dehydrogenase [Proteobacteria bacterium]|nr:MAG: dihydrolipoyl dehydrogenase [Pseudomonadota bacterium]